MNRILFLAFVVATGTQPALGQIVIPAPDPLLQWTASADDSCLEDDVKFSKGCEYVVMGDAPRIIVINTLSKEYKVVHEHPSVVTCWICPQTGGLFVLSIPKQGTYESKQSRLHSSGSTLDGNTARLDYLAEPKDWYAWDVAWSLPIFYRGIGIQFLEKSGHVAILEREPHALNSKGRPVGDSAKTRFSYIRLLDRLKLEAGDTPPEVRIKVPGLVGGLEWMDEGLVVVYASAVKQTHDFVFSKSIVDVAKGKLTNTTHICRLNYARLSSIPRPAVPHGAQQHFFTDLHLPNHPFYQNYHPQEEGNRVFRFRGGPQPGDLHRLVARMQVDPTFYMNVNKLGVLDEQISTLGDRTLYSHDPQNRQPFWYLDNSNGSTYIADVVPKNGRYQVLTVDRPGPGLRERALCIWEIDPQQLKPAR